MHKRATLCPGSPETEKILFQFLKSFVDRVMTASPPCCLLGVD